MHVKSKNGKGSRVWSIEVHSQDKKFGPYPCLYPVKNLRSPGSLPAVGLPLAHSRSDVLLNKVFAKHSRSTTRSISKGELSIELRSSTRSDSKSNLLSRELSKELGSSLSGSSLLDRLGTGRTGSRPNSRSTQRRFYSWQVSQVAATRGPARRDNVTTLTRSEAWAEPPNPAPGVERARQASTTALHLNKSDAAGDPVVEPELNLTIKKSATRQSATRFEMPPDDFDDDRKRRLSGASSSPNHVNRVHDLADECKGSTEQSGDGEDSDASDESVFDTGAAVLADADLGHLGIVGGQEGETRTSIFDILKNSSISQARREIKRSTKRQSLAPIKPPKLHERMDAFYGLPDLTERMAQVQETFFGGGLVLNDETSRQRLKKVFQQFRVGDGTDILIKDLNEILQFLGFIVFSQDDMMSVLRKVTRYDELDFPDFAAFIENYTVYQFEHWRKLFDEFDEDGSGEVSVYELRQLLSKMGYVVSRPMIEEAIAIVDDGNGELSFEEFVQFLTVYNHTEGFPHQDLEDMFKVFHDFAGKRGSDELQAQDVPDALVAAFGLQAEHHAHTIGKLATGTGSSGGITFPDFLMFAKRLRLAEHMDYKVEFEKFDDDGSGSIDTHELGKVMQQLGYKPMRDCINEIMREVHFNGDTDLDFEEFFHFMMVFRQRDGFTLKELDRYLKVFDRYDYDKSDTIDVHELGDMLRYLGHQVDLEDVRLLVAKVDVNKDGTLDSKEYTRLMRIYRETELQALQTVFDKHRQGNEKLSAVEVPFAIQEYLGPGVPSKLAKVSVHKAVDFDAFVSLADACHEKKIMAERKKAGFSNTEIQTLQDMFQKYDADGSGDIDAHEVQKLLNDFGLKCRTREERQQSLDQVDEARSLAKEAGALRDERTEDAFMTFWELVQLVRLVKTHQARQSEEVAKHKMEALRFSRQEIDDFRMVFLRWARTDGRRGSLTVGKKEPSKEQSAENMLADNDASISVASLQKLIKSLGISLTLENKLEIDNQLAKMSACNGKGRLTFVGFLELMQWMLETNFAGLSAATSNAS
eukprot:TRINITY_DN23589_c0_g1_i1.p1 TRINITY_DN23589_c0_g1~~TRINITY_DN23589_c0_g1_i1.p1  ORF type:complete len:1039 (+),score=185.75 TRINITY_DN23589_c0_g1_i1:67-3183(+)